MICDYEISTKKIDGYEEITINDFCLREAATEKERKKLINSLFATNIHMMVSMETYNTALQTIYDAKDDPRLKDMNAIVFLSLKQKGRGTKYTPLSQEMFNNLVMTAMTNDIKFGFDSCSAHKFLTSVSKLPTYKYLEKMTEPCESTLFSSYIDVNGDFYPCSFCEKVDGWVEGLSVVDCEDFLEDIWNHEKTEKFRNNLLQNDRNCPVYDL